jgi:hypothetical protein
MNRLMKELSDAINGSLADSDQISQALARIKEEGYDVYLVVEASPGPQLVKEGMAATTTELVAMPQKDRVPEWPITAHDARFLRSLHILIDDAA